VSTNLAPFIATFTQALEVEARRAKHERRIVVGEDRLAHERSHALMD
jgi:hypothetical protein